MSKKIQYAVFILLILIIACISYPDKNCNKNKKPGELVILDSLYKYNIDSAINYAKAIELKLPTIQNPEVTINIYSFFSEIYQYRLKNEEKALTYISKALNTLSLNPQLKFNNPYFFINIGNILLKNNLPEEAIKVYKYALNIDIIDPGIYVLIYHNIFLSYLKTNNLPYAELNLKKANTYITDTMFFHKAQHYNYKIKIAIKSDNTDSIHAYYRKIRKALTLFGKTHKNNNEDKERITLYHNELIINTNNIIFSYYKDKQTQKKLLQESLKYAKIINQPDLLSDTYLKFAELFTNYENKDSCIYYKLTAINEITKTTNYKSIITNIDYMLKSFPEHDYDHYLKLKQKYADSLSFINNNEKNINNRIKLAQSNAYFSLLEYQRKQKEQDKLISEQKTAIYIIIGLLFIVIIAGILVILNYKKLLNTQKQLAIKTINKIRSESKKEKPKPNSIQNEDELLEKLEKVILIDKIYLNPNLKLSDLAKKIDSNQTYISKLINQNYNYNFNDYINNLRVQEFCKLIEKQNYKDINIDMLYSKVGFKAKSTFYAAFKKFTGVSPAQYLKLENKNLF